MLLLLPLLLLPLGPLLLKMNCHGSPEDRRWGMPRLSSAAAAHVGVSCS
jgi:hypothetical protein